MQIGFAGLGRMGTQMVRNLARAGFDLVLWTRSGAQDLADEIGAKVAETPAELAQRSDVVVTMLADDAASEAVHFGKAGLFAGNPSTIIESGTLSLDHVRRLLREAPDGCRVMDAPVSGATQAAKDAKLLFMAGAEEDTALAPIFDAMGRRTMWLGAPGAGAVMKLAVNSLLHGINQSFAEAMALAQAAGVAPEAAFDVIEDSAAAAPMLSYRRPLYLDEGAHDVTFTVALAEKDMRIALDLAQVLGVAMPQGEVTRNRLRAAIDDGYGARDMAAMLPFAKGEKT